MIGDFEVKAEDLAGRIGIIHTKRGKLETPAFFPVVTPFDDLINQNDLREVGFNNFITNAYFLKKIKIFDKIHDFFKFNGVIMTDSGAYQILEYGGINASNREIVEYENHISPDIAVFLDYPTGYETDYEKARFTVEETVRRASEIEDLLSEDIVWVHPIQGGVFEDLVAYSAKKADENPKFSMLALGSPTVLMEQYRYTELVRSVFTAKSLVSRGKTFHLFGAGIPHLLPLMVAMGVDTFDSASYILYARDGRYITRDKVLRLKDLQYFPCSCPICSRTSPQELRSLSKEEQTKKLAIHNLYTIYEEIKAIKVAIYEGRLFEYIQQKAFTHPAVYSAYMELLKHPEYLEKYDPKTSLKGIFLFDSLSLIRPEVRRHRVFLQRYGKRKKEAVLVCDRSLKRPYYEDERLNTLAEKLPDAEIFIVSPFFGLIPFTVSRNFPLSQFESPKNAPKDVVSDMMEVVANFCKKYNEKDIFYMGCEKDELPCGKELKDII